MNLAPNIGRVWWLISIFEYQHSELEVGPLIGLCFVTHAIAYNFYLKPWQITIAWIDKKETDFSSIQSEMKFKTTWRGPKTMSFFTFSISLYSETFYPPYGGQNWQFFWIYVPHIWKLEQIDIVASRIDLRVENSVLNKIKFAFDEEVPWEFSIFDNLIFRICEEFSKIKKVSQIYTKPIYFTWQV